MEFANADIANRLDEVATLLEEQGANAFRVRAYRNAAATLRRLDRPVAELFERDGFDGLLALPDIGEGIGRAVRALLTTGRLPMLERLRGASDPEELLRTVPGIGPKTAERLHDDLGIDSLEALEVAAHDGRLEELAGLGEKRIAGIRDLLATRLGRAGGRTFGRRGGPEPAGAHPGAPPVAEILDVDREYRERQERDELPRIAPRRMNPSGERWLPILHAERDGRHYTALFSNTARAHELGRTHDWVVVYLDGDGGTRQYTVVTGHGGPLDGRRVVRGRETECRAHYERRPGGSAS